MKPGENWYRDLWLVIITGIMAFALLSLDHQQEDTDKLAATTQMQRRNTIYDQCRDQNFRHDDTIERIDHRIAVLPPGSERDRAVVSRDFTVALVDALAPRRDCLAVLRKYTQPETSVDTGSP